jgi:hypothetical protein
LCEGGGSAACVIVARVETFVEVDRFVDGVVVSVEAHVSQSDVARCDVVGGGLSDFGDYKRKLCNNF